MSSFKVCNRYSIALMELADSKSILDRISSDVEFMYATMSGSKELRLMLASPIIKSDVKLSVLNELFASTISVDSMNFLKFVVEKNREKVLPDIFKRFLELRDLKLGFVNVEITSAVELTDKQREELKAKLQKITEKKVKMKFHLDQSIIGGMLIRIGDTIMDSSVAHQLELLKKRFLDGSPAVVN